MRLVLLLLIAILAAGCAEPEAGRRTPEYSVYGAFTTERNLTEFEERVAPFDVEVQMLESYPEQFVFSAPDMDTCQAARSAVADLPYLAHLGECEEVQTRGEDDDTPVSSTSAG